MLRRRFSQLLGGVLLAPLWGCRPGEADDVAVARILGLKPEEAAWLEQLGPEARRDLRAALESPGGRQTARAVDLTFSLVGNRSRTFAFAGYPVVADRRSVCDGLLRE